MKNFFRNIGDRISQWTIGRYGYDELCYALSGIALVGMLLSFIPRLRLLYLPALLLWVWAMFRCCSKKIEKRQKERAAYLRLTGQMRSRFQVVGKAWRERKTHRYYRCKQCHTVLRVPKGRGKIKITCPGCRCEIIKKT
jgi:hypothetical protein